VAGLGGAGTADCGTRCSRWPDTRKMGDVQPSSVVLLGSGVEVAQARFGASVLSSACMPRVSVPRVSLPRASVSGPSLPASGMRRITSGPRELSGLQSDTFPHASPRRLHAARADTASGGRDAGTRPCSTSGLVCLRHNNTDVQGDHVHTIAVAWVVATAVRGMRRSVRRGAKEEAASLFRCHRQPVSLRRPASLFATGKPWYLLSPFYFSYLEKDSKCFEHSLYKFAKKQRSCYSMAARLRLSERRKRRKKGGGREIKMNTSFNNVRRICSSRVL